MSRSIKLTDNLYWDTSSITHEKTNLKEYLKSKETELNKKVNKSGDTLTGALIFNNTGTFEMLAKNRTINEKDYQLKIGLLNRNGHGAVALQIIDKTTNSVVSQFDLANDYARTIPLLIDDSKTDYLALRKERTIGSDKYYANFGIASNGAALMEIYKNNVQVGRLDVMPNGTIRNGKTGQTLIEEDFLYHKVGEQITVGGYYAGTFTSANTSIQFTITTPKWLDKVSKATIAGNVILRHADGGYIANAVSIASIGTVGMGYKRGNQLSFGIALTKAASSFANNSVVSVTLQDCKVTFS